MHTIAIAKLRLLAESLIVESLNFSLAFSKSSRVSVMLSGTGSSFDYTDVPLRLLAWELCIFLAKLASSTATLLSLIKFDCVENLKSCTLGAPTTSKALYVYLILAS